MRPPENSLPIRIGLPGGFIAGLIVGLLLGWFFHGVVGLVVRLGFALLLLIPIAIVIWYFFIRSRMRPSNPMTSTPTGKSSAATFWMPTLMYSTKRMRSPCACTWRIRSEDSAAAPTSPDAPSARTTECF